jgi:hypothetical protein
MQERGEKRVAVERLRTEDSSQAFLKDLLLMTVEIREGVEDALLADRAALANDQPEVMRQVAFISKIFNFAKRTKKVKSGSYSSHFILIIYLFLFEDSNACPVLLPVHKKRKNRLYVRAKMHERSSEIFLICMFFFSFVSMADHSIFFL